MRGATHLGALFLCVASLVAALQGEALLNRGYKVSVDEHGNPVYVKWVGKGGNEEMSVVYVDVNGSRATPRPKTASI